MQRPLDGYRVLDLSNETATLEDLGVLAALRGAEE